MIKCWESYYDLTLYCSSWQQANARTPPGGGEAVLAGGPLSGEYQMLQLHFHWGEDDTRGSEHTIDGKEYPLEVGFRARSEVLRQGTFNQDMALLLAFSVIVKLQFSPKFLCSSV